ncbi:hypothetical protein ACAG26_03230 [Mycobacterium sp. pUA109]|uniref:hypothetical protein n=1 Tax=Mycobacterium sp. pUA109 TaxID=3238982 RepID=UPI00351BD46A
MTEPGFITVTIQNPSGGRLDVSAQRTPCSQLVLAPSVRTTPSGNPVFDGGFTLVHTPTGRRVAASGDPASLLGLARRLAWFDGDLDVLADSDNAGIRDSVEEIVRQWRIDEAVAEMWKGPRDRSTIRASDTRSQGNARGRGRRVRALRS